MITLSKVSLSSVILKSYLVGVGKTIGQLQSKSLYKWLRAKTAWLHRQRCCCRRRQLHARVVHVHVTHLEPVAQALAVERETHDGILLVHGGGEAAESRHVVAFRAPDGA